MDDNSQGVIAVLKETARGRALGIPVYVWAAFVGVMLWMVDFVLARCDYVELDSLTSDSSVTDHVLACGYSPETTEFNSIYYNDIYDDADTPDLLFELADVFIAKSVAVEAILLFTALVAVLGVSVASVVWWREDSDELTTITRSQLYTAVMQPVWGVPLYMWGLLAAVVARVAQFFAAHCSVVTALRVQESVKTTVVACGYPQSETGDGEMYMYVLRGLGDSHKVPDVEFAINTKLFFTEYVWLEARVLIGALVGVLSLITISLVLRRQSSGADLETVTVTDVYAAIRARVSTIVEQTPAPNRFLAVGLVVLAVVVGGVFVYGWVYTPDATVSSSVDAGTGSQVDGSYVMQMDAEVRGSDARLGLNGWENVTEAIRYDAERNRLTVRRGFPNTEGEGETIQYQYWNETKWQGDLTKHHDQSFVDKLEEQGVFERERWVRLNETTFGDAEPGIENASSKSGDYVDDAPRALWMVEWEKVGTVTKDGHSYVKYEPVEGQWVRSGYGNRGKRYYVDSASGTLLIDEERDYVRSANVSYRLIFGDTWGDVWFADEDSRTLSVEMEYSLNPDADVSIDEPSWVDRLTNAIADSKGKNKTVQR